MSRARPRSTRTSGPAIVASPKSSKATRPYRTRAWSTCAATCTTNTIEGFWGNLRRGLDGIYHSVSRKHLHRYLSEFQFRFNNRDLTDGERAVAAIKAAQGKRLTYAEQVA
jgi:transposase-like protein